MSKGAKKGKVTVGAGKGWNREIEVFFVPLEHVNIAFAITEGWLWLVFWLLRL